jgi:hypothetical protein
MNRFPDLSIFYENVRIFDFLRINREMQELAFFIASVQEEWRWFNVRIAHNLWGGNIEYTIGDLLQEAAPVEVTDETCAIFENARNVFNNLPSHVFTKIFPAYRPIQEQPASLLAIASAPPSSPRTDTPDIIILEQPPSLPELIPIEDNTELDQGEMLSESAHKRKREE